MGLVPLLRRNYCGVARLHALLRKARRQSPVPTVQCCDAACVKGSHAKFARYCGRRRRPVHLTAFLFNNTQHIIYNGSLPIVYHIQLHLPAEQTYRSDRQ